MIRMKGNVIYKRNDKEVGRSEFNSLGGLLKLIVDLIPDEDEIVCELELDDEEDDDKIDLAELGQQMVDGEEGWRDR